MGGASKWVYQLLSWLLGITILTLIFILGVGPALQNQADDQSDQISTMTNDPMKGKVDIPAITDNSKPAASEVW